MDVDLTFGAWLRQRRRMLDLTQKELARQVGCAVVTIRKFEADDRRPSKELAERLAICLKIPPAEQADFVAFARAEPYLDPVAPPVAPADSLPRPPPAGREKNASSPHPVSIPLPAFLKQDTPSTETAPVFVARERELAKLAAALAQALSHPYSLATAGEFAAWFHTSRGEGAAVQPLAEAVIRLSTEHGFPFWLTLCTFLRGWALAKQGYMEEGIPQMRQGLAAYRATGAEVARPCYQILLAEMYGQAGQVEEGLAVLAEALTMMEKTGERFWVAEAYRLKGELLLKVEGGRLVLSEGSPERSRRVEGMNDEPSPEACFLKAIEVARRQEAKLLELRAVMSLSRLRQTQRSPDKIATARQMLIEVYDWFSEGFDTPDLRAARALLETLR